MINVDYRRFWNSTFLSLIAAGCLMCPLIAASSGGLTRFGKKIMPFEMAIGALFAGAAFVLATRDFKRGADGQKCVTALCILGSFFLVSLYEGAWFLTLPSLAIGGTVAGISNRHATVKKGRVPNNRLDVSG